MGLDPSTISEVIAIVSAVAASGGVGGAIHTKRKSSKLAERIARLEEHKKNTNDFIKEVKSDIKEIKHLLMKGK